MPNDTTNITSKNPWVSPVEFVKQISDFWITVKNGTINVTGICSNFCLCGIIQSYLPTHMSLSRHDNFTLYCGTSSLFSRKVFNCSLWLCFVGGNGEILSSSSFPEWDLTDNQGLLFFKKALDKFMSSKTVDPISGSYSSCPVYHSSGEEEYRSSQFGDYSQKYYGV